MEPPVDDTSREHASETGPKKTDTSSEVSEYLKAQREEEAWLERMQAAAKARKAKEEAEGKEDK
jgi:hypothetical protein